jgi:hypothetical protein
VVDPYAQRYHFWMHYANEHASSDSPVTRASRPC